MTTFQSRPDNGGQAQGPDGPRIGQRMDQLGADAQQLWNDARGAVTDLRDSLDLKGRVERNPYGTMLAAFGVGYVLGGGLFTTTTARLIKLGLRLAALPLVKDELLGMAETAVRGYAERAGGEAGVPGSAGGPERPQA